jgi:hypothetical protein
MKYPTYDTNWTISAKGNCWRRLNKKVLVVGQFKDNDYYWAMRDGEFLKGRFESIEDAQIAAERNIEGDDYSNDSEYREW